MRCLRCIKKTFSVAVLLLVIIGFTPAQDKPMITVLPFSSIEVPAYISQIITQLFETHLVNTMEYDVLSQNEREQILAAQSESLEGCTDESCAIEIGRMLAAEQVILGTVAALGTKYIINAKIIDVTTSKTLGADMISAASVEELDSACKTLTFSLVQKALPEVVVEAEPEPGPEPEPEPEVEPEPVPEPEPESAEAPKPKAPKPKPVRTPGSLDLASYLTHTAGVVLQSGGNIAGLVAFGAQLKSLDAWNDYMGATDVVEGLYEIYTGYREPYTASTIASYIDWGAGAAAYTGSWMFTDGLSLSGLGKILYAAGTVLGVGGNVSAFMSGNMAVNARNAWGDYMAAETGIGDLYGTYDGYQSTYETTRYVALGYWALGGGLLAAAPFMPGEKYTAAPSFLNRLLFSVGSFLISAGNFASVSALNFRLAAEEAFADYMTAAEPGDFYDAYDGAYGGYQDLTITSYALWASGGIASLVSLFVPFDGGAAAAELPTVLRIQPAPTGFGAEFHIILQ